MKASEVIARLEELKAAHGDLPVGLPSNRVVVYIDAYDEVGDEPSKESPATEFYLHGMPL